MMSRSIADKGSFSKSTAREMMSEIADSASQESDPRSLRPHTLVASDCIDTSSFRLHTLVASALIH
jgi:hypothetical protein